MSKLRHISFCFCFVFLISACWVLCGVYGAESSRKYSRKGAFSEPSIVDGDDASAKLINFLFLKASSSYAYVLQEIEIRWRLIVGSVIGFSGAALGSAGGIGAGGIFIPMLTLVLGFDPKSSTAISKCTSSRSLFKGVEMWKMETEMKIKEAALRQTSGETGAETLQTPLLGRPVEQPRVSLVGNVKWKQLTMLILVWLTFLAIQIFKEFTTTCSTAYWVLYLLQIPVAYGASFYQALRQKRKSREIDHSTDEEPVGYISIRQLLFQSLVALLAGMIGGLLGLGGGFLLSPLFLEIGIIPQVSSATATFVMTFSASLCVIEYYLLNRFPLLYAIYFASIAIIASLIGQFVVKNWIARAGRPSLIVFILSSIILVSAILLGGTGISDMIYKINHNEYMGFEDLCGLP
ncbi:sulfite exporter TauE/SafE family protein 3-like [Silene latifolia]|uniref:sulfite exporter TauE/SafE family protein 3-like n=1 Tax=Silene latifolia TaxID=37657 RepID=UPI003D781F09